MGSNLRILAVVAATLLVAACGRQLATVGDLPQQGNAFDQALYANYLERSKHEYDEGDYGKSDVFANKARSAAAGEAFGPVNPADYDLPEGTVPELTSARARLVAALDASRRTQVPDEAARAQVMYDCWVEEQEENIQPDDIAFCRGGFLDAIAKVEEALKPKAMAAAAMPPEDFMLDPKSWVVYFDFDKTDLSAQSLATIDEAAAYAATSSKSLVVVEGHTDTAGSSDYNDGLAADRAEVVANRMREIGVPKNDVAVSSFGQELPAVATPDGVAEPLNRRVEIQVRGR
jgi:outer membrane protein OmpA-like peptidoglycan-associated protein